MNSFKFGHAYITGIEWGILESTRLSLERQRERQRAEYAARQREAMEIGLRIHEERLSRQEYADRQRESIERFIQTGSIAMSKKRHYGI